MSKAWVGTGMTMTVLTISQHWIQDCPQKVERDPNTKKPRPGYVCKVCQSVSHIFMRL